MPAFLVATLYARHFGFTVMFLELEKLAACIQRDLPTMGPLAETGRPQSGVLQRNAVKLRHVATGLTVLAFARLRALGKGLRASTALLCYLRAR